MFDERVLANLDVLDHLQLYGSTTKAAEFMGLSQSSCSRRYRALSALFDLSVDRSDGGYEPRRNIDVLAGMRQVAQKLRVRRSLLRGSVGWQVRGLSMPPGFRLLDLPSMATGQFLTQLEGRLVDVWVGGLFECQPLISAKLGVVQGNRLSLGHSLLALPLLRWDYVLVSHRTHPLQRRRSIGPDDLAQYPSMALPIGVAPLFTRALQEHGLASCPYGSRDYDASRWEGIACDGHSLAVVPPHRLPQLEAELGLVPVRYPLGIQEVIAAVGHHDAIADPCFERPFHALRQALRESPIGRCSAMQLLH